MISVKTTVALALLATALAAIESGDDGVDRKFADIAGSPHELAATARPNDCAAMCQSVPACKAWAYGKPQCFATGKPLCWLKNAVTGQNADVCRVSGVKDARLLPLAFSPLPLGSITPTRGNWLHRELQIQADGLAGYLPLFWPDVMNSSWVGGNHDGDLHERTPYWMNGIVPNAFMLNDERVLGQESVGFLCTVSLSLQVRKYVDYILAHQQAADGWLGPTDSRDPWSRFPLLLAFTQYAEASNDARIVPAIYKFLRGLRDQLFMRPLGTEWAAARWQDLALSVQWLYDKHPQGEEMFLLDLIELLKSQGLDWKGFFRGSSFPPGPARDYNMYTHGVNVGQALKSEAVFYRYSQSADDVASSYQRIDRLDLYHGQASGIFGCDEHLAGNMPSRGSELCTVVETLFSFEVMFSVLGNLSFVDRIERLAYNALPATFTDDNWTHQYLQQSNEMNSQHCEDHIWATDGPDSNIYGLEPNFGCCTANFPQGWPKFAQHAFMINEADGGLVAVLLVPVTVNIALPRFSARVRIEIKSEYPFSESAQLNVSSDRPFSFYIRIPGWCNNATVFDGARTIPAAANTLLKLNLPAGQSSLRVNVPMRITTQRRYNNAASIYRGPLLYSLAIPFNETVLKRYAYQARDLQYLPSTEWNIGIVLQDSQPEKYLRFVDTGRIPARPFSPDESPVFMTAKGRVLPNWQIKHCAADEPPRSPVASSQPLRDVLLIPFGSSMLRLAEIPTLTDAV